jgi:predicted Rdx family selenoprotein
MRELKDLVAFALSNMEDVCLQGLGVGLQLQRVDGSMIWNRKLFPSA